MKAAGTLVLWALLATSGPAQGAGRAPYGGSLRVPIDEAAKIALTDPHVSTTASQRVVAALVHCRLFSVSSAGRVAGELATDARLVDGVWSVTLVRGARFHNGQEVTSGDVAASLRRARSLGDSSRAGLVGSMMRVRADGKHRLLIELPQGVPKGTLQRMLARPELSILARGEPAKGGGCGAFRPAQRSSAKDVLLKAFGGHAQGRPRLDRVTLSVTAGAQTQVERFVFDRVDVSFEPSYRFPKTTSQLTLGTRSTLFLTLHPAWAAGRNSGVRRALWQLTTAAPLARYLPWEVTPARSPWPRQLAPSAAQMPTPTRLPRLDDVGTIIIAYPRGDRALADLARVIRDRLAASSSGGARVREVEGLKVASARRTPEAMAGLPAGQEPPWHVGVAIHDWAALDREQAAWEASHVLGAFGLSPQEAMLGNYRGWAARVIDQTRLVPLVHLRRSVYHRGMFHLVPGTGMVRFDDSYKRP